MFEFKLEELQTQVDQVKLDLASLKAETSEENKRIRAEAIEKDVAATKEAIKKELDFLKWSTDILSIETTKKLEAMLVALETSNVELATLKSDITLSPIVPDTENINKEIEKDTQEKDEEEKWDRSWIQKQRDGATSKEERKNNTWANVARVVWWIGVLAIWVRWIKKLFGRGKEDETIENENSSTPTEAWEEPSFWKSKFGKILKWTGIGTGAYYITHGFVTGNRWLTNFFNRDKEDKEQEKKKKEEVEILQEEVTSIKKQVELTKKEQDPNKKNEAAWNVQKLIIAKREDINKKIEALKKDWEEKNADEIKKLEAILVELDIYQREIEKIQGFVSDVSEVDTSNPTGETKEDETSDWENAPAAAATMVVWWTTGWVVGNFLKRTKFASEAVSETADVSKIKRSMSDIVNLLKARWRNDQLLPIQKENIEKSIKYFSEARDNAHAIEDVKIRKKLGDKLPIETLQKLDIDPDLAKKLSEISSDPDLAKKLANATSDSEIKKLLAIKNIDNAPDELVNLLKLTGHADEVKDITRVLAAAKPIKALAKWLRAIPYLDIAAAGIDVRLYFNEAREADLIKKTNELRGINKQQQANMHLVLAWIDLAVGITAVCLTCAASGPPWWIVGVVVLAAAGITMWVREIADTYYYDVVDFYTRNKEDYLSLYRMEIKQAILQATVRWDSSFPLSWSEQFTELFNWSNSVDENKTVTLEDAYRTMIYLEERNNYPTVATLNPNYPKEIDRKLEWQELENYTKEKAELDQVMKLRMEYIKKFLPHTTTNKDKSEYDAYISNIKRGWWINAIEQIVVDSKVYQKMKQDTEFGGYLDIKEYEKVRIEALEKENEQRFSELEAMYKDDPVIIVELYYNVVNYDFAVKGIASYSDVYQSLLPQITFIKKYYEYKFATLSIEKKPGVWTINDIDYVEIEKMLQNMNNGKIELTPATFNETEIKQRLIDGNELGRFSNSSAEYTSIIWQNIIYRIAKEVHGYQGVNSDLDLMLYFSPDKKDSLGIYFDDGWYVNVNRKTDREFTFLQIEKASPEEIINYFFSDYTSAKIDNIDTSTENSDDVLNLEYRNRVSKIIKEEKIFQTPVKKREVQKDIVEYISTYGKEAYVKLPYNLVNDAKRAGLWNVEYFYYTYKEDTIHACTSKWYIDEVIDLGTSFFGIWINVQKEYVENTREELSEEEQKYIEYVETAHQRLMQLRRVKSMTSHEDELDLPEEFEKSIWDKYKEWQNFKETLLGYSPEIAKTELLSNYLWYQTYFESVYMSILIEISGRNFSNDIDGYEYLVSVLSKMNAWYFDFEKKTLKDDILTEKQTVNFYKLLSEKQVFGKTIKDLIKSSDEEEQQKWFWAAKQVLKSFLESQTLSLEEDAKISDINSGEITERGRGFLLLPIVWIWANVRYDMKKASVMEVMLQENLKEDLYLSPLDTYIDTSTIKSKSAEELQIKKLTKKEQKTYEISAETLKKIEDTQENVVWQDQRGNLIFDPEKSTITSRWASVKIDLESMKVDWLNITYPNLLELLYMANLINRTKWRFLEKVPTSRGKFFFGSRTGILYVDDGSRWNLDNDTDVVSKSAIKEKYPKLLSESNQKTFINYINKV